MTCDNGRLDCCSGVYIVIYRILSLSQQYAVIMWAEVGAFVPFHSSILAARSRILCT